MFDKRDPVCRIKVSKNRGYTLKHNGKTYYFDSEACRETFKECPHRFLKRNAAEKILGWLARGGKDVPKSCHEIRK